MSKVDLRIDGGIESRRQRPHAGRRPIKRSQKTKQRPVRKQSIQKKDSESSEGSLAIFVGNERAKEEQEEEVVSVVKKTLKARTPSKRNASAGKCSVKDANCQKLAEGVSQASNNINSSKKMCSSKQRTVKRDAATRDVQKVDAGFPHHNNGIASSSNADSKVHQEKCQVIASVTSTDAKGGRMRRKYSKNDIQRSPRAMSLDEVSQNFVAPRLGRELSDFPGETNGTNKDLDVGNKIVENFSKRQHYDRDSPKLSRSGRFKTFFRRLTGSLESLLKIGRRTRPRHSSSDMNLSSKNSSYNNPLFVNYSSYITVNDIADGDPHPGVFPSSESLVDCSSSTRQEGKKEDGPERSRPRAIAFTRGKRLYLSPREQSKQQFQRPPAPPKLCDGPQKRTSVIKKKKVRSLQSSYSGVTSANVESCNWETRSNTDSEDCAFVSNKLGHASKCFSSGSDSNDSNDDRQSIYYVEARLSRACSKPLPSLPSDKNKFISRNTENLEMFGKTPDFSPTGAVAQSRFEAKFLRQRIRNRNAKLKGPIKALRDGGTKPVPVRAESTGRYDTARRGTKRGLRRLNSSFWPCDATCERQLSFITNMTEAASFEQIMNNINDMANSLDQVRIQSHENICSPDQTYQSSSKPSNEVKTEDFQSMEKQSLQNVIKKIPRRQSWVGDASNRLDKLIRPKSKKFSQSLKPTNLLIPGSEEGSSPTDQTPVAIPAMEGINRISRCNSSYIQRENISFDELEKDFRDFARKVRQKEQQSSETVDVIDR